GLAVIEDAAEAHLAEFDGVKAGTMGRAGIFSFTPSKLMTTGEGGMIVTDDQDLAGRARLIRNFGDQGKFEWRRLGFNFRMPEALGAIGVIQLEKLAEACDRRRAIAARYTAAFRTEAGIVTPWVKDSRGHVFQLYTIRLDPEVVSVGRDEMIRELSALGIEARLYYPCLHRQGVFAEFADGEQEYPNAEAFEETALSLPIYPTMSDGEIEEVVVSVLDVVRGNRKSR
ncbi:MAG: DegT/DnrJ/EryC1/StrS family aminotransferase, partial [Dehalococcoidia bacterium]